MPLRPEQYGMKTVHTGNRSHEGFITQDMRNLAKRYAKAHGHCGASGGWIYDSNGQHICHGWMRYWQVVGGLTILNWARREGKRIPLSLQQYGITNQEVSHVP